MFTTMIILSFIIWPCAQAAAVPCSNPLPHRRRNVCWNKRYLLFLYCISTFIMYLLHSVSTKLVFKPTLRPAGMNLLYTIYIVQCVYEGECDGVWTCLFYELPLQCTVCVQRSVYKSTSRFPAWTHSSSPSKARILKHSMEAEKSTFQGELSFQTSESTAGLTVYTTFLCCSITLFCVNSLEKPYNYLKWSTFAFYI